MQPDAWFAVTELPDGIVIIGEPRHEEGVRSFLVRGERGVALIDTGLGIGDLPGLVARLDDREPLVLQTHGHWDHIGASHAFRRVLVHESEAYALRRGFPNSMYRPLLTPQRLRNSSLPPGFDLETAAIPPCEPSGTLAHGDVVDLGGRVLEVLHTPGHSPGGLSFLDRRSGTLLAGDVVNQGGIWLFLPRSDAAAWRQSVHLLAERAGEISGIWPSHGDAPLASDVLPRMRDAIEEVWAGRRPDRRLRWDIGFPERVPVDAHDFGDFTLLLGEGRYGAAEERMSAHAGA